MFKNTRDRIEKVSLLRTNFRFFHFPVFKIAPWNQFASDVTAGTMRRNAVSLNLSIADGENL